MTEAEKIIQELIDQYEPNVEEDVSPYLETFLRDINKRLNKGWDRYDVKRMVALTEHFQPDLSEEYALRQMRSISKKYVAIKA